MELSAMIQPLIIIASAGLGLILGVTTGFGNFSVHLMEPFLMVLLFLVFISVDGKKIRQSFKDLGFTLTALAINFIWTPIFAFLLGRLFFSHMPDLQIGLLMLLVTPCTDWYLVFTALAKGNVELGASILPLNLLLQILLLPVYLLIFFGGAVRWNSGGVLISTFVVLAIPFVCSFLMKRVPGKAAWRCTEKLKERGDELQLLFLCLAVIAMFASESESVFANPGVLLRMMLPLLLFFAVNFLLVRVIGSLCKMPFENITSLNFTTLARNSPLSLAIAVAAFPDRPLILLALVIGPLIELPALGVIAGIVLRMKKR